ncbi:phage tail terminator protein [Pigmentiphaga kullae]|uniref:Gp37 protein n=1 Tax=Pigmentiphaga kullae TaxID=151784 RepID=A0A4Q7NLS9_9BURK|nr:hypothetical protein [Pigmentiphaga kullae]RZS86069.1 hypothetical protein EV675_2103 [Pigmentiphaga kullae]
MDVRFLVDRLKERITLRDVAEIGGAADLDAARRGTLRPRSIYVVPLSDRPRQRGNDQLGCAGGRIELYAVLLVVDQVRDATGGEALAELPALRRAVAGALRGWQPDQHHDPVEFMGGQLVQFTGDGHLWWSDEYGCVNHGPI